MNYNTALCHVCRVEIVQTGLLLHSTAQTVLTVVRPVQRSQSWGGFRSQRRMKSLSAGYTSTPLIRDPSKTMVKS